MDARSLIFYSGSHSFSVSRALCCSSGPINWFLQERTHKPRALSHSLSLARTKKEKNKIKMPKVSTPSALAFFIRKKVRKGLGGWIDQYARPRPGKKKKSPGFNEWTLDQKSRRKNPVTPSWYFNRPIKSMSNGRVFAHAKPIDPHLYRGGHSKIISIVSLFVDWLVE